MEPQQFAWFVIICGGMALLVAGIAHHPVMSIVIAATIVLWIINALRRPR